MDQSEEAAFTVVENWWKKSFDISKNANDPLFSLFTKSLETIMVYMSQSLDYDYIEREISSLDKDRQLALQSENGYDPHRCLSFGLIEAVHRGCAMMMKKNTKKLEEMIKQGFITVPEIPKFPLEPKEEEIMDDLGSIAAENEISSLSVPLEGIEQPIDGISQDVLADVQMSLTIDQNFQFKEEEEMMDDDVNTGMDDLAPEIDNSLNESTLENEIMDQPNGIIAECDPISNNAKDNEEIIDNKESSLNQTMNQGRKSTGRITRPVNYNSMEDSDEEEVELMVKKTKLDSVEKKGKDSSQVKCVLCETFPKSAHGYTRHLNKVHKTSLNASGIYLICWCSFEIRSLTGGYNHSKECNALGFTLHKKENKIYSSLQCILCEVYPTHVLGYAKHLADRVHKSSLKANGIYLLCSCGFKVRCSYRYPDHDEKCDGLQFTLHRVEDEVHSTPKCILCETFPKTAYGYATHLKDAHKSTLNKNGIHLLCSCGFEIRSEKGGLNHIKKCEERQFSLHKNSPV